MYSFKEFLYNQRKPELVEPYILISENITDKLHELIQDFDKLIYDPDKSFTYFGAVRHYVEKFNIYWNYVESDCDAACHYLNDRADKNMLLKLIKRTKAEQRYKQDKFKASFAPATTPVQQALLKEIEELFDQHLKELDEMQKKVESFRYDREVKEFCEYHVALSLRKTIESRSCMQLTIAMKIADQSAKIKVSLESVLKILKINQVILLEKYKRKEKNLLNELYDLNKYRLELTRRMENTVKDVAQEDRSILKLKERIKDHAKHQEAIIEIVRTELEFWEKRYLDFMEIYEVILKCERELDKVRLMRKTFVNMSADNKLRHMKHSCNISTFGDGGLLDKRENELIDVRKKAAKAMISFFAVKGLDQVEYNDNFGKFNIDEYGHKLYYFNYGDTAYHTDCYGNYFEPVVEKHQFDECGRYFIDENGEKIYQCGVCTSKYKIDIQGLLHKITKDCGHSEMYNAKCKMNTNALAFELLPDVEPVDFKNILKPEVVNYLKDAFTHILPEAIMEVFKCHSKNSLTALAHYIIKIGYKDNEKIRREQAKEAEKMYHERRRNTIGKERNETKRRKFKRANPTDLYTDEDSKMAYYLLWEKNNFDNIVTCNNMPQ